MVALVTLGCDKNTVDSERYLAQLVGSRRGARRRCGRGRRRDRSSTPAASSTRRRRESIDAIVEAGRLKLDGPAQAVVGGRLHGASGTSDELAEALPEVDLFLGASEMEQLVPRLLEHAG